MLVQTVAPEQADIDKILKLEDTKGFCRVVGDYDDTQINSMILAAIKDGEDITNRQFATATYELYIKDFEQDLRLPKNPIQEIKEIKYFDIDGIEQTLDADLYYLYEDLERGTIHFDDMPKVQDYKKAVKITFVSGYKAEDDFPPILRLWLMNRVNTFYNFKEEYTTGSISKVNHVDNVLKRYKIRTF